MALEVNYPNRDELVELAGLLAEIDIDTWWKGDKKDPAILKQAREIKSRWLGEEVAVTA